MAFAIFYKPVDAQAIATAVQSAKLTGQERQYATRLWGGGLFGWQTAPQAPVQYRTVDIPFEPVPGQIDPDKTWVDLGNGWWRVDDPTMVILVLSGNGVTKQATADWLRQIGTKYPELLYMTAIADDILLTAVEPWV